MRRSITGLSTILILTILVALVACEAKAQSYGGTVTALPGSISGWTVNTTKLQQNPAPETPKPAATQPTAEQKAKLTALAKAWNQKLQEADSARKDYVMELLNVLAELGLKPSETSVTWNEKGEPVFNRVEPTKPTAQNTPNKEAKP